MDHQAVAQLLGNYGEFVGAIAVVATLFYLAVQVKHSKEATEAQTRSIEESRKVTLAQSFQTRASETANSLRIAATSVIATLTVKYEKSGVDSLDEEERLRLHAYHMSNINRLMAAHYHYEQGLLPDFWLSFKFVTNAYRKVWLDLEIPFAELRPTFQADLKRAWDEVDQAELSN